MLASVVIVLRATDPGEGAISPAGRAARYLGRTAQALLLDALRRVAPEAAAAAHDGDGVRPFTAALSTYVAGDGRARFRLRWTALEERLGALLLERALPAEGDELRVDSVAAGVERVAAAEEEDEWAGKGTYSALVERGLLAAADPPSRIRLRFASPTTFRSEGRNVPVPLPGLVFGSLIDRWNAFSPITLNPEARRFAAECLAIARYRLESAQVEVAGGKQVGCVGYCEYAPLVRDAYWLRVMQTLADFAFYAGVGAKTTMGMGQARRIESRGGALSRGAGRDAAQAG